MSERAHRIAFGMDRAGRMRAVREVSQGLACACVCPCCEAPLIARKGHVRVHHFAHGPGVTPCLGGPETAVHQMAKQIIAEADHIMLPAMMVREPEYVEPDQAKACEAVACPAETMRIRHARVEATEDRFRPDVVISDGDKELWLEVRVAHRVSEHKHEELRAQGTGCLEIDIRDFITADIDVNVLRRRLLDQVSGKVWLAHPEERAARERARAEWDRREADRRERALIQRSNAHRTSKPQFETRPKPRPIKTETGEVTAGTPTYRWIVCPKCRHMGSIPYEAAHAGRRFQCSRCGAAVYACGRGLRSTGH